jgi:signal transduction histidine kinase
MRIFPARNGVATALSAATAARAVCSLAATASLFHWVVALPISVRRVLPPGGEMVTALVVGVAYYAGAELAFWVGTLSYFFAPLWPPNMILFCALLRAPYRAWWLYLAAVLPAHIVAETGVGMQMAPLLGAFVCNVALALCSAAALRRLSDGPPWLDTLAKAWIFILVVAVAAPTLIGCGIAALGWLSHNLVGGGKFATRWAIANVLGGIALAPIFVTWVGEGLAWLTQISAWRALEAAVLTIALAVSAYVGFPAAAAEYPVLASMPIPLMLWAAVRFGPRGASGAILMVSIMALAGAIEGRAPFAAASPEHTILSLQMFLAVLSAPFLVLAAVVMERRHATAKATLAHEELQSILDNTPAGVCVRDLQGRPLLVNLSARNALAHLRGTAGETAYDRFPPEIAASWRDEDQTVIANGKPMVKEERRDVGGGDRLFLKHKFPLRDRGEDIYAVCTVSTDVTELDRAKHEVQDLSARLLSAQDEERRRIARELHDGTVQTLTAVTLNLSRLIGANPKDHRTIEESIGLLEEAHSEIRTLSYLLHPPALDEFGLVPALRVYVDGFTKRTGIDVTLRVSPQVGRMEADIEMALFRIVQESLSNVHRHSGAKSAEIRIEQGLTELVLSISDDGQGIVSKASAGEAARTHALGVGIAGMNARLNQLGGRLHVQSESSGTTVIAVVPHAGGNGVASAELMN